MAPPRRVCITARCIHLPRGRPLSRPMRIAVIISPESARGTGSGSSQRTSFSRVSTVDFAGTRWPNSALFPRSIAGPRIAFGPPIEKPASDCRPSAARTTSAFGSFATTPRVAPQKRPSASWVTSSTAMRFFAGSIVTIFTNSYHFLLSQPSIDFWQASTQLHIPSLRGCGNPDCQKCGPPVAPFINRGYLCSLNSFVGCRSFYLVNATNAGAFATRVSPGGYATLQASSDNGSELGAPRSW